MNNSSKCVLITGGAGYVGSVLVPRLLKEGYQVKVLDLYIYGEDVLDVVKNHPHIEQIKGDIRDHDLLKKVLPGCDAVIHLACISNDPSFELNPTLSRSINYDAFEPLVQISKESGVRRFIYASSASVYGVSDKTQVTEDHPLVPITDYNKYKALCEPILQERQSEDFVPVIIRPATICGYSPRQRFDLTVNILTNHAVNTGKIKVFGGEQKRPNLHIGDMIDLYVQLIEEPDSKVSGKVYNVGFQNYKIKEIAEIVKSIVERESSNQKEISIETAQSDDIRSYHISSEKIHQELGFVPKRTIEDAVEDLFNVFSENKFDDPMSNPMYFNIKRMQSIDLK